MHDGIIVVGNTLCCGTVGCSCIEVALITCMPENAMKPGSLKVPSPTKICKGYRKQNSDL